MMSCLALNSIPDDKEKCFQSLEETNIVGLHNDIYDILSEKPPPKVEEEVFEFHDDVDMDKI